MVTLKEARVLWPRGVGYKQREPRDCWGRAGLQSWEAGYYPLSGGIMESL